MLLMPLSAIFNSLASSMQAFGYSFIPMCNSIVAVLGFRVFWLELVYPRLEAISHTIDNVYLCYSVSWILLLIAHTTTFAIIYSRYKKDKIKQF